MDASSPPDAPLSACAEERERLAARLRALGHPARLEVLGTLARQEGCMCGEIVRALPLAQSTVSEHLKVLAASGLIVGKAEGPRSCYRLDREGVRALKRDLDALFSTLLAPPGTEPDPERD